MSAATFVFLALLSPSLAQLGSDPHAGKNWDPITGFDDRNAVSGSTISSGRSSSPWSFPRPLDSDFRGGYDQPATFGGIVYSGNGRHCGGLFRMVAC